MMLNGSSNSGRNRSGYRAAIHGRMGERAGVLPNDYTLRKGAPATLVWPRYEGGPLIFRPLPAVDPDDPRRFLPCRYSLLEYDFTDWTRRYTAARGAGSGENRLSFIIEDPTRENYGIDENPYRVGGAASGGRSRRRPCRGSKG